MTDVFYINLDRVPARRSFMEGQFARVGISSATRVSATDASLPGALEGNGYVPGTGSRWGLTPSEIACFESHKKVWRQAVEQGLPSIAVFEDDVEFSQHSAECIRNILAMPHQYDLVKFDYSPRALRFGPERDVNGVKVRPLLEMAPSAAAYALSLDGCRKLLAWSDRYSDHLDDFVLMPRSGWKMYQCFPAVGVQVIWSKSQENSGASVKTSERTQDKTINSGLDKGPLWFRARRELIAAGRKLRWRSGGEAGLLRQGGFSGFVPVAADLNV